MNNNTTNIRSINASVSAFSASKEAGSLDAYIVQKLEDEANNGNLMQFGVSKEDLNKLKQLLINNKQGMTESQVDAAINIQLQTLKDISSNSDLNDNEKAEVKQKYFSEQQSSFLPFKSNVANLIEDTVQEKEDRLALGSEEYDRLKALEDKYIKEGMDIPRGALIEISKDSFSQELIDKVQKLYVREPPPSKMNIQEILLLLMELVKSAQGLVAAEAGGMNPIQERTKAYTKLKTLIPFVTPGQINPATGVAYTTDEIAQFNQKSSALIETVGAWAGLEGDKLQALKTELTSTDEFAKKAQDFFSSLIDLLRGMFTKVTQG